MKSRCYFVPASEGAKELVEVRWSRTRKQMHRELQRIEGMEKPEEALAGLVRSWSHRRPKKQRPGPGKTIPGRSGRIVARMHLCKETIGTEILVHECGHAAMAYARLRRADLKRMPGEEVMCYSLGYLARHLTNLFYRIGVW